MVQVSYGSTQGSHWSTYTTYQQEPTSLIEASTNVNAALHTDQKAETRLWSVSMTNNYSSITTLQRSTASTEEALVATRDNSIAHFTLTAISEKKDHSMQQISLPLSKQTCSLLATSKLLRSSSSLGKEPFTRTASLLTSGSDISVMTSTTTTSGMVISNSTYELAAKISKKPQNSLTVGSNSTLFSHREDSGTTIFNHTVITLLNKNVATKAWSSSSLSLSPITTLSRDSSLYTKSHNTSGRSASEYQDRQTVNISVQGSSGIIFDSTVSLRSHSAKSVLSQSTFRASNTLVSKEEYRWSSEMHVIIAKTDVPGEGSGTQTAGHSFTNGMSLQTTMTLGSLTKTIHPSFHTKGSKESFSVTPMAGKISAFLLPSSGNGLFYVSSLPSFSKGTESLLTYPRTVASSMSAMTSTAKAELNTSYNMASATETLILAHTLKLSNNFSRMSLPTSRRNTTTYFPLSITSLTHTINTPGVLSVIHSQRSSVESFSTIGSLLPPSSFTPTITQSVTKTSLISKIYQTTDVLSQVNVTLPSSSNITTTGSSLPDILNKTSVLEVIPSSYVPLTTDVFSKVHATTMNTSVITSFQTFTPKSILAEAKTSRKLFPSSNALGNILTSIYQTEKITSGSPTLSMGSPSRVIKDSASESSVKDASKKLTRIQHLSATRTPAFSSLIKDATVRINTSNIRTVRSNFDSSLDTFASGTISIIKSTMLQTSHGVSTSPFTPSLTDESFFSVKASNASTLLSTSGSGNRLQSPTLAYSYSSLPRFIVSTGASETSVLVLTTQKPSKGVSVTMQDKSSTIASVITVSSPSTEENFSSASGLPLTSNTKQQRTYSVLSSSLTSPVGTLPWKTSTVQNTYVYVDSKASRNQTLSRAKVSLYSSHSSLQLVSTSEIMLSNSLRTTHQLSTTALPQSTHVLTSKSVNLTQGLTFAPSSKLVGYVSQTRATSTTLTKTSASSRDGDITEVNTVESSALATSSHAIKPTVLPFESVSTNTLPVNSIWTSFSKTKETLDSIQTQSSPSQETSPFTKRTTSSIGPDTTKTFETATTALEATVSVSTQTGPPPVSPKQFDVSMVLQMIWESHYEYSYTPEFQALASKIKTQVTTVLITLDGFLSLNVIRFWKSSVGVDFVVFLKKGAEVSEDTIERTVIEANDTGVLDLPLTSIQVQERETTITTTLPATQSTNEDRSIERWVIILIVAGILVFLMTLIICCLVVSKL